MLVKVYGAAVQGVDATIVTIEVNTSRGIKFFLVGLPDAAVKESSERIRAALLNTGCLRRNIWKENDWGAVWALFY